VTCIYPHRWLEPLNGFDRHRPRHRTVSSMKNAPHTQSDRGAERIYYRFRNTWMTAHLQSLTLVVSVAGNRSRNLETTARSCNCFSMLSMSGMIAAASMVTLAAAAGIPDQDWGYIEVRPGAHIFWWLYGKQGSTPTERESEPLIWWHQGGPGASSVGYGSYEEIGPVDQNLQPRNTTWAKHANLLFIVREI